jgi:prohibitin 2
MENVRNIKIPQGPGVGRLAQVVVMGGAAVYGLTHSLFNVEGGHRYGLSYANNTVELLFKAVV